MPRLYSYILIQTMDMRLFMSLESYLTLAAPFLSFDGMNEKGFSMKRKTVIITMLASIIIIGLLLFISGGKMTDVYLNDYVISEDGNTITIKTGVASSIGYVRTMKERDDKEKKYISFYSTYGLNSNIGANNEFQISLQPTIKEIYFDRGDAGYVLVLQKNIETNEWKTKKQ